MQIKNTINKMTYFVSFYGIIRRDNINDLHFCGAALSDNTSIKMSKKSFRVFETDNEVASKSCQFVIDKANEAINARGVFAIGVSGK